MSKANPLRPGEGKRTVSLETVASQQQVEEHKLRGKREAYMKRHELYVKSMYGNVIEKEQVRQKQRALLQEQIAEQDNKHRQYLDDRYKESNFAIHYDEACRRQDAEDRNNRKAYLQKFRDENKRECHQLFLRNPAPASLVGAFRLVEFPNHCHFYSHSFWEQ
ncbi:predicted protein [Nematostella vectensis]|uniref:Uncharacterized protein n=1 Tax=Nematostella vectensis TaxID=45351 RepID=A7T0P4_NEMVE|nr:predicted protein [Nematostella vectensis]|eukprot:XP_001622562.1 predicted protein [Nematostella vectensis]